MEELAGQAFRRHYRQVYGFVRRRTSSDAQAEDITGDVFADAAAALDAFRPGATPVLAWLYVLHGRIGDGQLHDARASPRLARRRRG